MQPKLKVLDLFSGIGGFSFGLERTGGFSTVAFCEIEPFPRKVLAKHWPEVPQYEDVTKLTGDILERDGISVDVLTGGFPCQDVSITGKGKGINGSRTGLWRHAIRIASETLPQYIILENVPKIRSRGLEHLLIALDEIGYDAEWHCIPAAFVGAPHRRDRIWIIAYRKGHAFGSDANMLGPYPETLHVNRSPELRHKQERVAGSLAWWGSEPKLDRMVDGIPTKLDITRLKSIGNAVVPQIPELIGLAIIESEFYDRTA